LDGFVIVLFKSYFSGWTWSKRREGRILRKMHKNSS